jgi:hypothetical protein
VGICRDWLATRIDRGTGRETRDIAIRRIGRVYWQIGVKRSWLRRMGSTVVIITRIKEASPSMINIIREEINDCQRTLRMQSKTCSSN